MRSIAFGLLGSALMSSAAFAQDIGGRYSVEGTNFNGSPYRGTAEIILTSENTCRILWDVGTQSEGICMRYGIAFSAAYVSGTVAGLTIYEVLADGTLSGIWTIADQQGVGTEILTPIR